MRICLTLIFLFAIVGTSFAQECDGQRYYDEIFDVEYDGGIVYGEGLQPTLFNPEATSTLRLDVYQPEGDTLSARPLIIWAFGGSFVFGTRLSPDIITLSNEFTSRGYVNASIDYRLSTDLVVNNDEANAYEAVMKATHDMAAAVRFFYKDAATVNDYRIDTTRIYIGGVSAGAFAALHLVHLDDLTEVPPAIYDTFVDNGGLVGNSGNAGYSHKVAGIINLSGALGDSTWIDPLPVPVVSMHGTNDGTVPYGSDLITILGIDLPVDGSSSIHTKLDEIGTENAFYTWYGAGHTPFVTDGAYMDTTVWFVRDFLFDQVCEEMTTSIGGIPHDEVSVQLYPNPNQGYFNIEIKGSNGKNASLRILDYFGREIIPEQNIPDHRTSLDLQHLAPGMYLIEIRRDDTSDTLYQKLIIR